MTEKEARKKRCPMVNYIPDYSYGKVDTKGWKNEDGTLRNFPKAACCVASECACWIGYSELINNEQHGYCGLTRR